MDSVRIAAASQSTLLAFLPTYSHKPFSTFSPLPARRRSSSATSFSAASLRTSSPSAHSKGSNCLIRAKASSVTPTPTPISERDLGEEPVVGGGEGGGEGGGFGRGGGGGGGGDREENEDVDPEGDGAEGKKMAGISMSQKLTVGYAALVGVGGVMGYMKSGSQKSALAGGLSALLLYFVYTQLPVRPAFASSLGLGLSAALLAVMGSRFKKSGKVFPAGIVSFVSLIMVGGYFHGILRSLHV